MRSILIVIFSIILISCAYNEMKYKFDMSEYGAVNTIKEINGTVYLLNSTNSSVLMISEGKIEEFRDLEIKGRDFLLDFDIIDDTVYYANTYDEIFKSSGSVIDDTIKVSNPDKIAVLEDKLFVTSRKPEDGFFFLKLIDLDSKIIEKKIALNDSVNNEAKFSQFPSFNLNENLWIINPFRNSAECYNSDLLISGTVSLPSGYKFGDFSVSEDELRIVASRDNQIFIITIMIKGGKCSAVPLNIKSDTIDINCSSVTSEHTVLYDYINSSVIHLTNR